jgi:hypothetical protein
LVAKAMTLTLAACAIGFTATTSSATSGPRISRAPVGDHRLRRAGRAVGRAGRVARHQRQPVAAGGEQRELRRLEHRLAEIGVRAPESGSSTATLIAAPLAAAPATPAAWLSMGLARHRVTAAYRPAPGRSPAQAAKAPINARAARREAKRAKHQRGKGGLWQRCDQRRATLTASPA